MTGERVIIQVFFVCLISLSLIPFSSCQNSCLDDTVDNPSPKYSVEQLNYTVGTSSRHIPILNYLTKWVGQRLFDPPIEFQYTHYSKYMNQPTVSLSLSQGIDFILGNPHRAACVASETNAVTLATRVEHYTLPVPEPNSNQTTTTTTTTRIVPLSMYGAVLYTLKERHNEISSVEHVRDKIIATNKVTNLATHLCYDLMIRNGIHHLQDPKQTIFTKNSQTALQAVLDGKADVGCAATGAIESYVVNETTGELLDWQNKIHVLNPQQYTLEDGTTPFPFLISTPLVSQFPFQAFPHVPTPVTLAVQEALVEMKQVAETVVQAMGNNNDNNIDLPVSEQKALDAYQALNETRIGGFTKPISNLILRDIQEKTGFLIKPEKEDRLLQQQPTKSYNNNNSDSNTADLTSGATGRCVRFSSIVDAVTCPAGHFVQTNEDIINECNQTGLDCYGYDCICKPCVKAFQVDVFAGVIEGEQLVDEEDETQQHPLSSMPLTMIGSGCPKFSVCGRVSQEHVLRIYAMDNVRRINVTVTGVFLTTTLTGEDDEDQETVPFTFQRGVLNNNTDIFHYDYVATRTRVGQKTIQIFLNGNEIPESPFRLLITPRDCASDTGNAQMVPDEFGECICPRGMVEIGGNCVSLITLLLSIFVPVLVLAAITIHVYVKHKKKQSDNLWIIQPDELIFGENPRVLGHGTFGVVLLAEYRGTPVAVKRVFAFGKGSPASSSEKKGSKSEDPEQPKQLHTIFDEQGRQYHSNETNPSNEPSLTTTKMVRKIGARMRTSKATQRDFMREMRLLSRLRHPCITTVMGAVRLTQESMMVMEHMQFGSLYDLLRDQSLNLDRRTLLNMLIEVASGLRFLHSSRPQVVHGDLKSKNILVDGKFRAKVADFGLASHKGYFGAKYATGTPLWMAPELIRGISANSPESDVYAFGITLCEVYSRKDPYEGEHTEDLLLKIASKTIAKRPQVPPDCPREAAILMKACWDDEPSSRPKATELDIRLRMLGASFDGIRSPSAMGASQDDAISHTSSTGTSTMPLHNNGDAVKEKMQQRALNEVQLFSSLAWRAVDRHN